MDELADMVRQSSAAVLADMKRTASFAQTRYLEREIEQIPQKQTAEDLHKFLEWYKDSQKAQERENKINRRIAIISMVVAIGSLIVSLVK